MHEDGHGDAHARVGGGVEAEEQEQLGHEEAQAQVAVDGGPLAAETCGWDNDYSGVSLRTLNHILMQYSECTSIKCPSLYTQEMSQNYTGPSGFKPEI